jgi:hypothetical protein
LTEEAVRKTFNVLATAASGSRLAFTYIRQDFMDGVNLYGAADIYQPEAGGTHRAPGSEQEHTADVDHERCATSHVLLR